MRIGVRGIDQIYPGIQRRVNDVDALFLVGIAIGAEHHGSESVCADADAGSSERAVFHVVSSLGVKRQEVVSGLAEATHRGDTSDALMGAMPVVMMIPARQHRRARGRMMVWDAVGPFAQRRLNEALGFAIGLRAIGT